MKSSAQLRDDLERVIEFDFVRATESAALHSLSWLGRGEKELADGAACDAIRGMFDLINICGEVVIGEGIKDNAPGIFKGEHLGTWLPNTLHFQIALDPIDGTTNIAKGMPNSISCIAAASPEEGVDVALKDVPTFYMMKLAYGPKVVNYLKLTGVDTISIRNPIEETLVSIARALRKRIQDLVVVVLDRPRHAELLTRIRSTGAALRMISDGDITAAIAPALEDSGVDLYVGIGGSPEAVLSSAGIKCLGGDMQTMMWPRDEAERKEVIEQGYKAELDTVFYADDLARGENIIFCATGISESALLKGVKVQGNTAITHSILMRAHSRTVRMITAYHDLSTKTIHLRSDNREHRL